jgi:pimeloyl-ACP methyl ester carboxylesterase
MDTEKPPIDPAVPNAPLPSPERPRDTLDLAMTDGATVRVRRYGRPGGVRLLVSHGNGFAVDGYAPFWIPFCGDCEVVVFDMRSHGQNPRALPANHDHDQMARDIASVRRGVASAFGARPSVGVFHSMSAQAAMRDAIDGHWQWDALVLFDPPNVPAPGHAAYQRMVEFEHRLARWAGGRRERFDDPGQLAADYAATRAGAAWVAGAHAAMARAVLRPDGEGWALACPRELEAEIYLAGNTLGLWPQRRQFGGPVKLIAADPARPFPVPTALSNQALAAEGGFDYAAIPGTGHLLQLEQPAACRTAVLDFLRPLGLA